MPISRADLSDRDIPISSPARSSTTFPLYILYVQLFTHSDPSVWVSCKARALHCTTRNVRDLLLSYKFYGRMMYGTILTIYLNYSLVILRPVIVVNWLFGWWPTLASAYLTTSSIHERWDSLPPYWTMGLRIAPYDRPETEHKVVAQFPNSGL